MPPERSEGETEILAERRDELAEKAPQGILSAEESMAFKDFGNVGRLLGIMKAKAKVALSRKTSTETAHKPTPIANERRNSFRIKKCAPSDTTRTTSGTKC